MSGATPVQPGRSSEASVNQHMQAVAVNINRMIGAAPKSEALKELPPTATLDDLIAAVNILIRRLSPP